MKEDITKIINTIKILGIDMIDNAKSGNPGITLGAAPIMYTLYANHINVNPSDPTWYNRDRFVMSSAHGSALLYATLYLAGYDIKLEDLTKYRRLNSNMPGYPELNKTSGVDYTTGPLGEGLAAAVGMAMSEKYLASTLNNIVKKQRLINHNIYCLVSDGDLETGLSLEAASLAGQYNLGNLIVLYDSNDMTQDGEITKSNKENILKRFDACGWQTDFVSDGTSVDKIDKAIKRAKRVTNKPSIIEIKTIIGKDSFNQGTNIVHDKPLSLDDMKNLRTALKISQIMTSKSPVRSCDDVDETALSFAEIKALCAGDPRIKERMDLDVEVARLKLMKADHQSKQYRLEDQLLKYFPQEIETNKGFIKGFEADLETLAAHPHPEDGFAGMEIRGDVLTDKENAGAALLDACKEVKGSEPVQIGSYRGFTMSVEFSAWKQEYTLLLKGQMTHRASLGTDPRGNLTRIDNALAQMPQRLEAVKNQLDNLYQQQAAAKEEIGKPFPFEDDLRVKSARLVELDTLLNIDGKGHAQPETVVAKSARPSVLDSLKRPVPPRSPEKKPKQHEEVR